MMQQARGATISVVIASYNDAEHLAQAVGQYATQSHPPDEIIVVVDGSTDGSVEILESLWANRPQIKIIQHDGNKGVNAAAATGVRAATGNYVRLSSTHDPVEPQFLERMLRLMAEHPKAAVGFCDPGTVALDGRKTLYRLHLSNAEAFFPPSRFRALQRQTTFTIPSATTVFRREALLEMGVFNAPFGRHADWYANLSCAIRYGACYIPEHLALYLTHPGALGTTASTWNEERRIAQAILRELCNPENADLWSGFRHCGVLPHMSIRTLLWITTGAGRQFVSFALIRHCLFESFWRLIRSYVPSNLRGSARRFRRVFLI